MIRKTKIIEIYKARSNTNLIHVLMNILTYTGIRAEDPHNVSPCYVSLVTGYKIGRVGLWIVLGTFRPVETTVYIHSYSISHWRKQVTKTINWIEFDQQYMHTPYVLQYARPGVIFMRFDVFMRFIPLQDVW